MSESMRIAYLLSEFPQLTQTFVTREISWIREHGVEPFVFSLNRPRKLPSQDEIEDLLPLTHYSPAIDWAACAAFVHFLFRFPVRSARALGYLLRGAIWEPSLAIRALMALPRTLCFARRMQAIGIEHIHSHFLTLASIEAGVAAELLAVDYSVTVHAVGLFTRRRSNIRRQMARAARVVTISRYHKKRILELCPEIQPEHVSIVYCGLDAERFQPANGKLVSGRAPRILSIGRLIPKKGFEYLIDACARLVDDGVAFECTIIGEGPLAEALTGRASRLGVEDRVRFLGAVEQSGVLEAYHRSDVFALPSVVGEDGNRDGLPVVLIEAMACGLPVVTTPLTGIVDLVEDGVTGLLVREGDAEGLAMALRALVEGDGLRDELARRGRDKVLRDFRIQETTRRLAGVFRQIRDERAAGTR